MRPVLSDHRFIYPLVLATFAGGLGVTAYLHHLDQQQQRAQARDTLIQAASMVRAAIEQQANTSLNLATGLVLYVADNPDVTQRQFERAAARILRRAPYIRNVALAKDSVLSHIHPLEGNRKALGFRLLESPQQRAAVVRTLESKHSLIAGPVDMVQGGRGFIGRIPVYLDEQRTRYWGLASVAMNVEAFFAAAGIGRFGADLDIALRGKDGLGSAGEVFYGDAALFARVDAVRLPISLPQGSWELAARARAGTQLDQPRSAALLTIGFVTALLFSAFLYVLLDTLVALSRANRRAEQASAQKARFFAHMTHELRTPLTAIHGVISLLASGRLPPDAAQTDELLQNALRNCQRLQWIVNDMLDLKKLESGTAQLLREPLSLPALIADAIDSVQQLARQAGVELQADTIADQTLRIEGDRLRLQQVLTNLLSNAIKYSPEHGRVRVGADRIPGGVLIEVADQGQGVSEDKLEAIFEEFAQDRPAARAGIPSTGLGLTISRQIVERHGGRLGCRNLQPRGCCFYLELPGAAPDTTADGGWPAPRPLHPRHAER